jgi:hypothetical protein
MPTALHCAVILYLEIGIICKIFRGLVAICKFFCQRFWFGNQNIMLATNVYHTLLCNVHSGHFSCKLPHTPKMYYFNIKINY